MQADGELVVLGVHRDRVGDVLLGNQHDDGTETQRAAAVLDDLVPSVILHRPAERVAAKLRSGILERRRKPGYRHRNNGLPHFAGVFGRKEPVFRAGQLPGRKLHLQPARDVVGAGRDRAGRADVRAERDLLLVEDLLLARRRAARQVGRAGRRGSARRAGRRRWSLPTSCRVARRCAPRRSPPRSVRTLPPPPGRRRRRARCRTRRPNGNWSSASGIRSGAPGPRG